MMGKISSRQVEAFRAVILTGSMTGAADQLRITQPAVSRLIQDFEAITELHLFERRANHLTPTRDALNLAEQVERSFIGLGKIEEYVNAIKRQQVGSLRIAAHPALATEVLPRFVGRFSRTRPDVEIRVDAMPTPIVSEGVASGALDFGYVQSSVDRPGFYLEKLGGEAVVIMRPENPLAKLEVVTPDDLAGATVIGRFNNLFQAKIDVILGSSERRANVDTEQSYLACMLVLEGAGVAIVDPFNSAGFLERGLVTRRFVPAITHDACLIVAKSRMPTPLGETFIAEFRKHLAGLIEMQRH